ncbi:MAG: DUF2500 domain-containing protein [Clostridia bacterium]|nr:DUF2500 domain-containing protein [Clostridia bacterium]MBQ4112976.1 DUF2500 domain-containing protein [Clostridia bacterium]
MSLEDMFESESFLIVLLGGLAVMFIVFILAFLSKRVEEIEYNDSQPKLVVKSIIIEKNPAQNNPNVGYIILFEFFDGGRIELFVPPDQGKLMAKGDRGSLTYQGRKFYSFDRMTDHVSDSSK